MAQEIEHTYAHEPTLMRFLYKLKRQAKYQETRIQNSLFTGATRKRRDLLLDSCNKKQLDELQTGELTEIPRRVFYIFV